MTQSISVSRAWTEAAQQYKKTWETLPFSQRNAERLCEVL